MDNRGLVRGPRRLLAVMLAGCLLLVAAACSPSGPPTESHTLTVGATLEPPSMDPFHDTSASIPQVLLYNVYETLLKVNSDGALMGLLAQTWEVSTDRLTYNFHLNPAATFASGAPVNATAVKTNLDRMLNDPKLTQTLRAQLDVVDSVEAPDESHVVIKLNRPSMMWLYEMSSTLGMIVDPTFTGDLADATAGSGPYQLQAHNRGQSVVLSRNDNYWGTPGRFDQVTFRYYSDPNAMNASMLAGDLDIISNLQAPDALSQFSDTSRFTTISGTTNGEVVLGLNNATEALSKKEVRLALTMGIDRKALMDTVWNGQGTLIGSMVVPTDPWYEDLSNLTPYDPAKAKELLAQAGYADGLKLRLRVPVVPYAVKSAQFVASQLRDIGVTVTIEELEFTRWISEVLTNGDYDMTIVAHVEARDIAKFANPAYYWHYDSAEFRRLFTQADEASEDEVAPLMKQAARYLAEDAAAIWLFALPNLVITKSTITGVGQNATSLSFDLTTIASA